jgi:NAD(P)H-dependent flavin oxidoreductase YrpB (nitropropane dioxygenase family)
MSLTNAESQRKYKARMYEAGYKQVQVWTLRDPGKKPGRMDRNAFIRKVDELAAELSGPKRAKLYSGLIKSIEAEKGAGGTKKK